MSLNLKFILHIKQFPFIQKQHKQLLAVSGGVDSVVLYDLMFKAGYDFVIAHCNFQLRGEESERDAQFVRKLGEKYNKEVLVKSFDTETYAKAHKLSIQVAARELRYEWFHEIIEGEKTEVKSEKSKVEGETHHSPFTIHHSRPHYIFTAHHADDNIETVVMNFFRGTGLKGLVGMDTEFKKIFRPLLPFRKNEILDYAKENDLSYMEDSSNVNSYYTRNYFRNELLPAINKVFPQVEENILKNIERLSEVEKIYENAIEGYKKSLIEVKGKEEHIPILKLQKLPSFKTILWEIIKDKSFAATQVEEVVKLMAADNGSYIASSTHRIIKNRKWLILAGSNTEEQNDHIVIEGNSRKIKYAGGLIIIEKDVPSDKFTITSANDVAGFDADLIQFPLLLRRWKHGDYFYPLGMQKKKKLSKFFIDQKLSKIEKENVWVIEMNKKVLWVVGHRIDDRFKLTAQTERVLKVVLKRESK